MAVYWRPRARYTELLAQESQHMITRTLVAFVFGSLWGSSITAATVIAIRTWGR